LYKLIEISDFYDLRKRYRNCTQTMYLLIYIILNLYSRAYQNLLLLTPSMDDFLFLLYFLLHESFLQITSLNFKHFYDFCFDFFSLFLVIYINYIHLLFTNFYVMEDKEVIFLTSVKLLVFCRLHLGNIFSFFVVKEC